jgi:tRNA A-37 threonylcarbamoyl transferase component Bud32
MTPERHARTKELFLLACRRPAAERSGFLREACGTDTELRARVEELLAHHSEDEPRAADAPTRTVASGPTASGGADRSADFDRRLETGAVIAGRYRIVDLLGRGGMGEVYRAEDLQLKQTVALKFLAPSFAHDVAWLGRFRQEVRLAREVTHPSVCRVYDLGEADGEHFISMEYVDGENLKALLSRIGRLPRDKALEIARQLCAGLAAAHGKGVLHRDLKPANVMLDGRGQVRITDFGLAATRGDVRGNDVLAGTPAYMAPEQLAGREVSVRSDLYALGLVLYELFTGQPAFRAESFAEYARLKESSRATPPSRLIEDIDPAVERAILACLEPRPADRPPSVLAVAAALPGSDLLAAALAAGETPSPDMVAAASFRAAVGSRWAAVGLVVFALLVVAVSVLTPFTHPLCQDPPVMPPQVLAERARDVLQEVKRDAPRDEASGFLDRPGGNQLVFWYRAGRTLLTPTGTVNVLFGGARVTPDDPPLTEPGMSSVLFDRSGRLLRLDLVPDPLPTAVASAPALDWPDLLKRTGLDPAAQTPCAAQTVPPVAADARRAWCGSAPAGGTPVRVEAAERAGQPVYLTVVDDVPARGRADDVDMVGRRTAVVDFGWKTLLALCILVSLPLARRNLQRGRSDLRGAGRLAAFVFVVRMLSWLLQAQHASDPARELALLLFALIGGLVQALALWLLYVALEPYARRYWPHLLVSWTRLLRGQIRDPLVGEQVLIGAVLGAGWAVLQALERPLALWLGLGTRSVLRADAFFAGLLNTRYALAGDLDALRSCLYQGLAFLLLFVLLRMLLRRPILAAVLGALLIAPTLVPRGSNALLSWVLLGGGGVGLLTWFMVRFGLLTVVTGMYVAFVLARAPLTIHLGAWYSDLSVTALALVSALALYGFLAARTGGEARSSFRQLAQPAFGRRA